MAKTDQKDANSIGDVVDGLDELAGEEDKVRIGDVLDKFGSRSFAPVMLVLALIEISPVGAIPGVPTFLALCVALVAVQLLFGRDHIWVPGWIENRSVSSDKMDGATDKLDGIANKLDKLSIDRMTWLTKGPAVQVAAGIILLLCFAVPPLEVLPWASAAPMFAIAIISVALMVRDGLAMLIAYIIAALATTGVGFWFFSSGGSGSGGGFLPF
ncbi:exopolysaccharide biosynthesis protein [Erythrobacter sp.]|jgi:hypothetical protein|uniref:exopolysaccharide biosynthesis protein n=1 Tax=Erythrobacter sp. TaxID=1042 RepID=UPI002ECC3BCD|nr:exopolysaccharide biosynthesis protein [Erythrobacter sp.]